MAERSRGYQLLDPEGYRVLAQAFRCVPERTCLRHRLRHGLCRVFLAGDPDFFDALLLQDLFHPTELTALGRCPDTLLHLVRPIHSWLTLSLPAGRGAFLARLLQERRGDPIRVHADLVLVMNGPPPMFHHESVRLLTILDHELIKAAPQPVHGHGLGSTQRLLEEGVVAGAVILGDIVALAWTSAVDGPYVQLQVHTLDPWRGRGLAQAALSSVVRRVRGQGRIPVLQVPENNVPLRRLAAKLGFTEATRLDLLERLA